MTSTPYHGLSTVAVLLLLPLHCSPDLLSAQGIGHSIAYTRNKEILQKKKRVAGASAFCVSFAFQYTTSRSMDSTPSSASVEKGKAGK